MIEVEVHQQLRSFLRSQGQPSWPHHLTMARLVARALRLGRSALIQTGFPPSGFEGRHRLSYLMPILMWPEPAILVAPESVLVGVGSPRPLMVEIPQLQQWMGTTKAIRTGSSWPDGNFSGLLIVSSKSWLADRLHGLGRLPTGVPTIVDCADDLEDMTRSQLRAVIQPADWNQLMLARPEAAAAIRDVRVQLTRAIFQHPETPYECWELEPCELEILQRLYLSVGTTECPNNGANFSQDGSRPGDRAQSPISPEFPDAWSNFWQRFHSGYQLIWASIDRRNGQFTLFCGPVEVASALARVWSQQPVVLIGGALDLAADANIYRQQMGLGDLTCVKFSPDRQNELIQLYLPQRLPMPNTPEFQAALLEEVRMLLCISAAGSGLTVILVGDMPLKAKLGAVLAAEFGSRVQVEKTGVNHMKGILVTGWEFWRQKRGVLPAPMLLAIATLPFPSLENPLVAARVAYYKRQRSDWFRLYLLPAALSELTRAIAPVRQRQSVVAILDTRVVHRSYGKQVLAAISPHARVDYLDATWFT